MSTECVPGLKKLWKTVFGDPDSFIDTFFEIAYSPDRCRYTVEDGKIVSTLYWFDCEYDGGKLAYIYAVATDPECRGRGLASRLLENTHSHLKALGYSGAVLKPASGLVPFYEKLGYVTSGFISRFSAESNHIPASLKRLSPVEYACARRQYLPEGGIIQEGAALDFLHSFAELYSAEGALVCAAREEPVIFEYLGDPGSAPGILAALAIDEAVLPTAGTDIPFAMFRPLNCTKTPGYLGISLE